MACAVIGMVLTRGLGWCADDDDDEGSDHQFPINSVFKVVTHRAKSTIGRIDFGNSGLTLVRAKRLMRAMGGEYM